MTDDIPGSDLSAEALRTYCYDILSVVGLQTVIGLHYLSPNAVKILDTYR